MLRGVLRGVAAACIPGVIVGSIADNDAVALTFGAVIAVAAFGLILVTSVTGSAADEDVLGAMVEDRIARLIAGGADEREVRALVADARRLGSATRAFR